MQSAYPHSQNLLNKRKKSPISMTALIDLVFILLMFFMLTSSFVKWQQIPLLTSESEVSNSTLNQSHNKDQLFFRLHANGTLEAWPHHLSWSTIESFDKSQINELNLNMDLQKPLLLIPEDTVALQEIVDTVHLLQSNGFQIQLTSSVGTHQ